MTDGGFAKRTSVDQRATKGRGSKAARDEVGRGARQPSWCADSPAGDELFAVANDGVVIRTRVDEVFGNRSRLTRGCVDDEAHRGS